MAYNRQFATGISGADAAQTVSSPGGTRRVALVTVAYSAAPTQAGVTVTLNSGSGAAYDCPLFTGTANARYSVYQPTDLYINDDDVIDVTAPAGGVGITSAIAIYTEYQ